MKYDESPNNPTICIYYLNIPGYANYNGTINPRQIYPHSLLMGKYGGTESKIIK